MAVILTLMGQRPVDAHGAPMDIFGRNLDDSVTLESGDSHEVTTPGLYRLTFTEDHVIRIGNDDDDPDLGHPVFAKNFEPRSLAVGDFVMVA